jgi:hypothetical protein
VVKWLARAPRPVLARSDAMAPQVTQAVRDGRFNEGEQVMAPGVYGPPRGGGAFWILNGLNPTDMLDVLRAVGAPVRTSLLDRVAATAGLYDTPRLTAALRAQAAGEHGPGIGGLDLLDAIRNAGTGSFAAVWALLAGKSRPDLISMLRVLPRDARTTLQGHLGEAPAAEQQKLTETLTDLQGSGTDMAADDVIDVERLRGLNRTMADIYNQRGRMLFEQATALRINTAAAAGIMKVESGGMTFSADTDQSIMRFENHVLWNRWGKANARVFRQHFRFNTAGPSWHGHRFRAAATDPWQEFHGNQTLERQVLTLAVSVAGDVAFECASFGAGQVMGFNHAKIGYATAKEMVERFDRSERSQITGIFDFIHANHLEGAVRSGNYRKIAQRYNGGGQIDVYADHMRTAAAAYKRVTAGKANVIP